MCIRDSSIIFKEFFLKLLDCDDRTQQDEIKTSAVTKQNYIEGKHTYVEKIKLLLSCIGEKDGGVLFSTVYHRACFIRHLMTHSRAVVFNTPASDKAYCNKPG